MKLLLIVAVAFIAASCADFLPKGYQSDDGVRLSVDLSEYKMTVYKKGKPLNEYPISYGGSDLHPTCQKFPDKTSCRKYRMSNPPTGHYTVRESHDTYFGVKGKKVKNVILFSYHYNDTRYVLRANKKDPKKIGKPLYTGGNLVLRAADMKAVRKLIAKMNLNDVQVQIKD